MILFIESGISGESWAGLDVLLVLFLLHLDVLLVSGVFQALIADVVSLLVRLDVSDYVDVGSVDVLEGALVGVDSDTHRLVYACDFDSITWSDMVNEVLIGAQVDSLGSFTLWYTFWCLLHLDMLLVGKDARVKVGLEGVSLLAVGAEGGLLNTSHLHYALLSAEALAASEVSLFHFRHNVTVSDHDSA